MSRERELLQWALEALAYHRDAGDCGCEELIAEINAELQRPEPVECGYITVRKGLQDREIDDMDDGKYRLLAEKIEDV
jgi:hypothetical protein